MANMWLRKRCCRKSLWPRLSRWFYETDSDFICTRADAVHVQEWANQWRHTAKMERWKKIISMNNISLFDFLKKIKSMVILPYNDRDHLCITAQSLAVQLNLPLWVQAGCGSNGHSSKNCLWSHFLRPKTHSSRGRAGSLAVIQLPVISCLILLLLNWIKSSPHLPASAS